MVNLKLRRIMIIVLCVFFTVTVFRCQVYESSWGIAKKQMRFDKETQTKLIDECCEKEHEFLDARPGIIFEGVVETIKELAKKYLQIEE